MPPSKGAAAPTGLTVDRARNSLVLVRRLAAPPPRVFEAWTDPAQVAVWWDPTGTPLLRCEIDLRVGGQFSFVGQNREAPAFTGIYREIAPPHRLVFEAMGALGTVAFDAAEGGTRMTVTIACPSAEHFEQFVRLGVGEGTAATLDNLVRFVDAA
ncbi:MAG: SRPBCC domain-containing protein [Reyranellaceae bacterium]